MKAIKNFPVVVIEDTEVITKFRNNKFFESMYGNEAKDIKAVHMCNDFGDSIIVINTDYTEDADFVQVWLHELGHAFLEVHGYENTEHEADNFAFDLCEELGYDTSIFKKWHEINLKYGEAE